MKKIFLASLMLKVSLSFAQAVNPAWTYSVPSGPYQWGQLASSYQACSSGAHQSPIAIETGVNAGITNVVVDSSLPLLRPDWKESTENLLNNGHTLEAIYDAGSTLEYEGVKYELKQFHFHSPSEHSINEQQYPLEMHMVHASVGAPTPKTLVVAVFFEMGRKERIELGKVWSKMPRTASEEIVKFPEEKIDVNNFLPRSLNYISYSGSLTTPPCTEGVQWILLTTPIKASGEQLKFLQSVLGGPNNRPLQSLDDRAVTQSID